MSTTNALDDGFDSCRKGSNEWLEKLEALQARSCGR